MSMRLGEKFVFNIASVEYNMFDRFMAMLCSAYDEIFEVRCRIVRPKAFLLTYMDYGAQTARYLDINRRTFVRDEHISRPRVDLGHSSAVEPPANSDTHKYKIIIIMLLLRFASVVPYRLRDSSADEM